MERGRGPGQYYPSRNESSTSAKAFRSDRLESTVSDVHTKRALGVGKKDPKVRLRFVVLQSGESSDSVASVEMAAQVGGQRSS